GREGRSAGAANRKQRKCRQQDPGSGHAPIVRQAPDPAIARSRRARTRLLLRMPALVVALLVLVLDRRPGHAVRGFLAAGVAATVVRIAVLVPGAVEGFLVDLLTVPGHVVAHRIGQVAEAVVGHGDAPRGSSRLRLRRSPRGEPG